MQTEVRAPSDAADQSSEDGEKKADIGMTDEYSVHNVHTLHGPVPNHFVATLMLIKSNITCKDRCTTVKNVWRKNKQRNILFKFFLIFLNKLQESEEFRLGNKLKIAHIQWKKQKMKVNLCWL